MKNIAASIRARLLNMARKEQVPFQRILTLYKQEGLLHRIVSTRHSQDIVLKGGLLFYQLQGLLRKMMERFSILIAIVSSVKYSATGVKRGMLLSGSPGTLR